MLVKLIAKTIITKIYVDQECLYFILADLKITFQKFPQPIQPGRWLETLTSMKKGGGRGGTVESEQ